EPDGEIQRAEKGASLTLAELIRSARLLKASRIIRNSFLSVVDDSITLLPELAQSLYCDQILEKEILSKILSEDKVADDASDKLYQLRRKIKRLNDQIREKLNYYVHTSDKYLQDSIVTMRGDRFVLPVKSEHKSKIKGFVHDQSATGSTLFIEPVEVLELNNQLRIAVVEESAEVEEIVRDLSQKVGLIATRLLQNVDTIIHIDEYCARAVYAYKTKSQMPKINEKGIIDIRKGRHPLIDPKKVVPLDVRLGKDCRYLLITGPNTGGKTVTLKLVGLFTLMAMSGIFIPASPECDIALFDAIYCDIGDEQSIEQSLSTFSSHLKNLVEIINFSNSKSFILIDEIGAGTDPDEGSALAQAIIESLLEKGSYGIITTHYSRLKEFAYLRSDIINASMDFDAQTYAPIYKLNIGIPGTSNAIEIASRLGLDKEITKYATSLLSDTKVSFENILKQAEITRKTAESERLELAEKLLAAKEELALIEREKKKLQDERDKLFAQAKAESRRIINEKVDEADELIEKIKEILDKEEISSGDIITARTLRNKVENKKYNLNETEADPLSLVPCDEKTLKNGDKVYVKSISSYAV
ncbi:MAG: endonuclease MutS2, partial [Clostridia bacterium]|nr:endonuclease MutS2 [Clostridia bacterium]